MPAAIHRSSLFLAAIGALSLAIGLALAARGASAEASTGTVTGRVLWGPCIRALPLPVAPDGQTTPPAVPAAPDAQVSPGSRPLPVSGLPAGAVLVALQSTAISARTDEAGRFTLANVPAGQYMTVAAGPVANSTTAVAERPNVFVDGGQSVDVGTLSLGGQATALACRAFPNSSSSTGAPGTDLPPSGAPGTDLPNDAPQP